MQCFANFSLYLKGREELVVTVYHGDLPEHKRPQLARITLAGCVWDAGHQLHMHVATPKAGGIQRLCHPHTLTKQQQQQHSTSASAQHNKQRTLEGISPTETAVFH